MTSRPKAKKLNKAWLHDHLNDPYVKLANREGYRARAAYKLKEIDETLGLIRPGQLIVDLGAAPGAWSQYARRKTGAGGATLIALDLLPMEPIEGVTFIQGDFREPEVLAQLESVLAGRRVDLVMSDMAPNLSGIASADAARVTDLVELAIDFAGQHLRPEGALVAKLFHGAGYDALVARFRSRFATVKTIKPQASRGRSAEAFVAGLRLRKPDTN